MTISPHGGRCAAVHPEGTGHPPSEVRLCRRVQGGARGRDFTVEERRRLAEPVPVGDRDAADDPRGIDPVGVFSGRGLMRVRTCPADPFRPHRLGFQWPGFPARDPPGVLAPRLLRWGP
ncbi:hypothetical protein [Streptomyces vietnamensis]|uniref:Uncharacterized protein n=1 Tax=Streptomyces vietnamensis TaxID=362257 RepID=A0A0B5IJM5_9ACTN|nr:hypothetical protein [Streptomyces vietnamensis]AJF68609.1 hypothetical protein SVTN_34015 [Streptomyces vietnamensis]